MANGKAIGEISQAQILAALLRKGYSVSIPWGDNQRYDFILDVNGDLKRVQCKTAKLERGRVHVPGRSSSSKGHRSYHGQVEYMAGYCPENGKCYLIPIEEFGSCGLYLRVVPAKNKQVLKTRNAQEFEL